MKPLNLFCILFVMLLISCNKYNINLNKSRETAIEFFNEKLPAQVTIPKDLKGRPNDKYSIIKGTFKINNNEIKTFYTINKDGKIGEMYVDGINLNSYSNDAPVALTRDQTIAKFANCPTIDCAIEIFQQVFDDCKRYQNSTHCWYCKKFGGDEKSGDFCCP